MGRKVLGLLRQELQLRYKISKSGIKCWVERLLFTVLQMLVLIFYIIIINGAVCGFSVVHGESMQPTLLEGDILLCIKLFYQPARGDIVICRTGKGYENEMVKRVIGMPGDEIFIDSNTGILYINGHPLEEPYCKEKTFQIGDNVYPVIVPKEQYFVLGDNREVSMDSRYSEIGTIDSKKIDGHVVFRASLVKKEKYNE